MNNQEIAIAMDIGGTKTLIGIVTRSGAILTQRRFQTLKSSPFETQLRNCIQIAKECLQELDIQDSSISGIGVALPGLVDPHQGVLLHAPYAGWANAPVREMLKQVWPETEIQIANDVNACAHGELVFGKGNSLNHFVWVTVSTGIGAGIVINKQIYEGERFIAGELGHVVVEWEQGRICPCGNKGCLEAHASGTAIAQAGKQLAEQDPHSSFARFFLDRQLEISAGSIAQAAYAGIQPAIDLYRQAGNFLGRAFSYVTNLLNPGAILLGGGVSLSFDLLEQGIREVLLCSAISEGNMRVPILSTGLGYEAGLLGAASLIFPQAGVV